MRFIRIFGIYIAYSILIGGILQDELKSALGASFYSVLAGPSLAFGRLHGLEFYFLASALCFPLFYIGCTSSNPWMKIGGFLGGIAIWVGFGIFLI
ncbi:MAG: hypothetical protein IV104_10750 [Acidovorax sp.]|nr:hypothetical protein [Acidovorax sp.]